MRLAILSDIHGNLPAFRTVLEDVSAHSPEAIWCLGDVVGYGADPNGCSSLAAERCDVCLVGNHDLAVLGELEIGSFSPAAAEAVRWTQGVIDDESSAFLRGLEAADTSREVSLYHASPRDPVWEYVLWPDQAAECIAAQKERISMVGHSHVALYFVVHDEAGDAHADGAQATAGETLDLSGDRWLINPGSVGQPRDGDPRAAWLELDTEAWRATYHRVEYPIDEAAAAIEAAGLPEHLARRLYVGQ